MNLRIVTFVSMQEIYRHFDSEKHGDAPGVDKVRCKYTCAHESIHVQTRETFIILLN